MNQDVLYDAVVVGGGPAGLTAALYLARARYRVLVVEKARFGGQITITAEVVNYPGVERASGADLTETMRRQAQRFGAEFLLAEVTELKLDGDIKTVRTSRGDLRCFCVLLATGAHPRMVGFKGEEAFRGHGVAYCATCDGMFFRGREVAVVGGGNTALEDAAFLANYCSKVYIIHRRSEFRGEEKLVQSLKQKKNVEFVLDSKVTALNGTDSLESLIVQNVETKKEQTIPVSGVFVAIGQMPQNEKFAGMVDLDAHGYVEAGENCHTNVKGIFVAGDCRTKEVRQLATAAADGAVAALAACAYLNQQ